MISSILLHIMRYPKINRRGEIWITEKKKWEASKERRTSKPSPIWFKLITFGSRTMYLIPVTNHVELPSYLSHQLNFVSPTTFICHISQLANKSSANVTWYCTRWVHNPYGLICHQFFNNSIFIFIQVRKNFLEKPSSNFYRRTSYQLDKTSSLFRKI